MIRPKYEQTSARRRARVIAADVPPTMKLVVDSRDKQKCVRCGKWLANNGSRHHRQRRQVGGHLVVNLILLCGSGTEGCHGWVHANPRAARLEGLIVKSNVVDIASVPLRILDTDESLRPFYVRLTPSGARVFVPDAEAVAELELVA